MGAPKRHETKLAQVCAALNGEDARYVLVGAAAMQLWGTTRATRDIDVLIQPTVANARRVLAALAQLGFGFATDLSPDQVARSAVTVVGDIPNVDILTRAWNVQYDAAAARATTFELEGVRVPTASIDDLIESKRTGRLQDAADIEVLEQIRRFGIPS